MTNFNCLCKYSNKIVLHQIFGTNCYKNYFMQQSCHKTIKIVNIS